jgi:hypothetical protein
MATTIIAQSYATIGGLTLSGREDSGVEFILQTVEGWGGADTTISPVQKPRQAGAWAGYSYEVARSIVLTGTTYALDAGSASDALDRLIAACTLDATVLTVVESGRSRWVSVRRDGAVVPVWISSTAFTWSVQFVAVDPRKFGASLTGQTALPSSTGGLTVPFTVPYVIASTVVSGQVSLTNPGNSTGSVILRIDGPCTGPVITRTGVTGSSLVFASSLVLNTGEWLTVNGDARTAMANDQANRAGYITSRGWPTFEPGVNTFSFTATGYNAASLLTVTATPAWK